MRIFTDTPEIKFKWVEAHELDEEGRNRIGRLGFFVVTPDMFITEAQKRFDGSFFYEHALTEEGWLKLEKEGLKHPGRGWVAMEPINFETLLEYQSNIHKEIKRLTAANNKIQQFINKHCDD